MAISHTPGVCYFDALSCLWKEPSFVVWSRSKADESRTKSSEVKSYANQFVQRVCPVFLKPKSPKIKTALADRVLLDLPRFTEGGGVMG